MIKVLRKIYDALVSYQEKRAAKIVKHHLSQ